MRFLPMLLAVTVAGGAATTAAFAGQQKPTPPPPPPPITSGTPGSTPPVTPRQAPATPAPAPAGLAAPRWRGVVTINGLFQPGTHAFTDTREFSYNRETAATTGDYDIDRGAGVDGGVFMRIWRQLGAGASVSSVVRTSDARFTARYPHPFFFGRQRQAETMVTDLDRAEVGVHLSAAYLLPSTGRFGGVLYAGPSVFSFTQDAIETLDATETYPYDTVTIAPGDAAELSETAVGFHAGADVAWYFTNRFGIGAMARYATAKTNVAIGSGNSFELEGGGFQAGLGLRIRF